MPAMRKCTWIWYVFNKIHVLYKKKKYTDEYIENKRVNNQIYDSYYDANIPVSDEKKRLNYISVESIRKVIREYKLADKSGGDNTYKQLDAFARSIMFVYPTMLTEKHKEFMDYTRGVYNGEIKTLGKGYEYNDINIHWEDLLILNEISVLTKNFCILGGTGVCVCIVLFRCVIRCNFCFMNSVFKRL